MDCARKLCRVEILHNQGDRRGRILEQAGARRVENDLDKTRQEAETETEY